MPNIRRRVLVPNTGSIPTQELANYVIEVAQGMDAELFILHIVRPGQSNESAELAIEVFEDSAAAMGIEIECLIKQGLVVYEVIKFAEENEINLILLGASRGAIIDQWLGSDLADQTVIPVLFLPFQIFAPPSNAKEHLFLGEDWPFK